MSLEPRRKTKVLSLIGETAKEENQQQSLPSQDETKPVVKHHTLFRYPLKSQPNPAFADYFQKLEEVKKQLTMDN